MSVFMTVIICTAIVVGGAAIIAAVTLAAQKLADWWYEYSTRRELDKIIEKELRQSRCEFRR